MAIYGHMGAKRGNARHVYLERDFEVVLDAIADAVSNSRLGPHGISRSQLINKAIKNYIYECRRDPALKATIEKAERRIVEEAAKKRGKETVLPLRVVGT